MNGRKEEIENVLKSEHGHRETEIVTLLRSNRKADDYLRRMDREDKRYHEATEAIRKYFASVDEWKKEVGLE